MAGNITMILVVMLASSRPTIGYLNEQAADEVIILRSYDVRLGFGELHDQSNKPLQCAARFPLLGQIQLDSVRVRVDGAVGDTAIMRIFGHEGGSPAPITGLDKTQPRVIRKTKDGVEAFVFSFDPSIELVGDQFFVSVETMSGRLTLLSDNVDRAALCACGKDEAFTYQCVKGIKGSWETYNKAFLVDAYAHRPVQHTDEHDFRFTLDTIYRAADQQSQDPTERMFLSTVHLDGDAYGEILTSKGLMVSAGKARERSLDTMTSTTTLGVEILVPRRGRNGEYELVGVRQSKVNAVISDTRTTYGVRTRLIEAVVEGDIVNTVVADLDDDLSEDVLIVGSTGQSTIVRFTDGGQHVHFESLPLVVEGSVECTVQSVVVADVEGDADPDVIAVCTDKAGSVSVIQAINQAGVGREVTHERPRFLIQDVSSLKPTVYQRPLICVNNVVERTSDGVSIGSASLAVSMVRMPIEDNARSAVDTQWSIDILSRLPFEDRVSACSWPDLDGNGVPELVMTSGSACRSTKMYREDPASRELRREFRTGIEELQEIRDICWGDLDGDGALDGVTISAGNIIVLWNQTRQRLPLRKSVPASVWVRAVESDDRLHIIQLSSGRGWDVHERLLDAPIIRSDVDSVWVHTTDLRRERVSYAAMVAQPANAQVQKGMTRGIECLPTVSANPFKHGITIEMSGPQTIKSVAVYTLDGQLVWIEGSPGHNTFWNGMTSTGSDVAAGAYILKVETEECTGVLRILKAE